MKFQCYKEDLKDALQVAIQAVAVKPMTPVLSGIYLSAAGNQLMIQANNNKTGILTTIPVNVEVEGEAVVSGKRFVDFVKNMPDDTITIFSEDNALMLESGGASVDLLTMNADGFPKVQMPAANQSAAINSATLGELVRRTIFAVAKDDTRPIFTGVLFTLGNDEITLSASNTHRLAVAKAGLEGCPAAKFIVPAETLKAIAKKLADDKGEVNVRINDKVVAFALDNYLITSRLLEGEYPPFDKVIPTESTTQVNINTAEFKKAIDFVALMAKETEYNTVKLTFDKDGVEVTANSDAGGAVKNVEAEVDGDDLTIAFNVNYIADALKVMDSRILHIELNDRYSPAAFTEPGNDNYIYVATPVRA